MELKQHHINLQIATDLALCLKPSAKILGVSLQLMLMLFLKNASFLEAVKARWPGVFSLALERYLQASDAPCDVTRGTFHKLLIF